MRTNWRDAENLLCIRLDNMGDVLMTTPALRALRRQRSGRRITLLASASGAAAAAHVDDIDEVIRYEAPWVKQAQDAATPAEPDDAGLAAIVEILRECRFDAAIVFTTFSQSALPAALLCLFAGIRHRVGYARENPYRLFTDWHRETEPAAGIRHEVERQLDLVAPPHERPDDLRLSFRVDDAARTSLALKLRAAGIAAGARYLVVHPGATAPSRRYPEESFAQVLAELSVRCPQTIVLTGSAQERAACERIRAGALAAGAGSSSDARAAGRMVDLAGRLDLGEFGALLEGAALLLSNNSGPVHVAAALGTPVVDLYALTNPQHKPWQVRARVLSFDVECRNCFRSECPTGHHLCLRGIAPRVVAEAVLELGRLGASRAVLHIAAAAPDAVCSDEP
ncbi:MAG: glycosyltransferase family 9 protein [Burkholderiaceae bacterium]